MNRAREALMNKNRGSYEYKELFAEIAVDVQEVFSDVETTFQI